MDDNEKIRLRVCSAIITRHRAELQKALIYPVDVLGVELHHAIRDAIKNAPIPGEHGLVKFTMYLPAWIQYVGQRGILLFPKVASRLLRSSGLHQQMY